MKILFSGYHNLHFLTITEYIEAAIEQLDHQLISFDDRQYLFPGRLRQVMPIFEKYDLKIMNQKLLQLAQSHQPDICLVTGGHRIFPETIQKLNSLKIKTVLWTIDV
ncbi:MAG: hypothetical protein KC733_11025, partial [Candidatus Omnitrophica bacterium]|nr:hypothetical protein [Candidatus Omnitrophota bacterium]